MLNQLKWSVTMFMRRRAFFLAPLMFILLVLGLGSLAGRARTNDAYQAGFNAGQASVVVDDGVVTEGAVPQAVPNQAYYGASHYGFHGFSFFFKMIFYFFMFGLLFKLLRFGRWRRWPARHHGARGPWQGQAPREKQPEEFDPNSYYV